MTTQEEIENIIPIITKSSLIAETEFLVKQEGMQYAEAIIHICEAKGIEPEDIAKLIVGPLKEKLKAEAQRNNILPKPNSLFND